MCNAESLPQHTLDYVMVRKCVLFLQICLAWLLDIHQHCTPSIAVISVPLLPLHCEKYEDIFKNSHRLFWKSHNHVCHKRGIDCCVTFLAWHSTYKVSFNKVNHELSNEANAHNYQGPLEQSNKVISRILL